MNHRASSDSLCRPALNIFDLLLRMMAGQADGGQRPATCGKCPSFPCGRSGAVTIMHRVRLHGCMSGPDGETLCHIQAIQ